MQPESINSPHDDSAAGSASTLLVLEDAPADEMVPFYRTSTDGPLLDAVYLAIATARDYAELLWFQNDPVIPSRFVDIYHYPKQINMPSELRDAIPLPEDALSSPYRDSSGLFRLRPTDTPSLHAIDIGLRLAVESLHRDVRSFKKSEWIDEWTKVMGLCRDFIQNEIEKYGEDGAFRAWPTLRPSVFGTYTAISAVLSYNKLTQFIPGTQAIEFAYDKLATLFDREDFVYEKAGLFALKQPNTYQGSLSTTAYGYRICALLGVVLGQENAKYVKLRDRLAGALEPTLRFIEGAWDATTGGFKDYPLQQGPRSQTVGHTRSALQLLRVALEWDEKRTRNNVNRWLSFSRCLDLILKSLIPEENGFGNIPGDKVRTIFSEQAAVNSTKIAEAFRLKHDFADDEEYRTRRDNLMNHFSSLPRLLRSYRDSSSKMVYAVPVAVKDAELRQSREGMKALCQEELSRKLPARVQALAPFVPFFQALCEACTAPAYMSEIQDTEFRLYRALQGDLRDLCFGIAPEEDNKGFWHRTQEVLLTWPNLRIEARQLADTALVRALRKADIVRGGPSGPWDLTVNVDAVPGACANIAPTNGDRAVVLETCSRVRAGLRREIEAFTNGDALVQGVEQIFRLGRVSEAWVFAAMPFFLLPEAFYRETFEAQFGWKSQLLTELLLTERGPHHQVISSYSQSLKEAAKTSRIFYSWNSVIAGQRLLQSYDQAPHGQRYTYLQAAKNLLSPILSCAQLAPSYYGASDSQTGQPRLDWRDWIGFIDAQDDYIVFLLRDPKSSDIAGGVRVSGKLLREIARGLVGAGKDLTPLGEILLNKWWQRTEKDLRSLAQILIADATSLAVTKNPRETARSYLSSLTGYSLAKPGVRVTIKEESSRSPEHKQPLPTSYVTPFELKDRLLYFTRLLELHYRGVRLHEALSEPEVKNTTSGLPEIRRDMKRIVRTYEGMEIPEEYEADFVAAATVGRLATGRRRDRWSSDRELEEWRESMRKRAKIDFLRLLGVVVKDQMS